MTRATPLLALALAAACAAEDPPSLPPLVDPARDGLDDPADCIADPGTVGPRLPCGCDADCAAAGAVCFDELGSGAPGGFCQASCDPDAPAEPQCGEGTLCVEGTVEGLCGVACTTRDDCADGGLCQFDGTCDRFCLTDDDCDSGFCDQYASLCAEAPVNPDGASIYARCLRDEDCRSFRCQGEAGEARCITRCDTARPDDCPDGGACSAPVDSDIGLCLPTCDGDIRECEDPSLTCQPSAFPERGRFVCFD